MKIGNTIIIIAIVVAGAILLADNILKACETLGCAKDIAPIELTLVLLFGLAIATPFVYRRGQAAASKTQRVLVYLRDCNTPLEGLSLYQTTNVDYRFVKKDEKGKTQEEIIIPISEVEKMVYCL